MMRTIQTNKAPHAIGPYSQAVESNGFVFCSGQIGIDSATGELKKRIEEQTKQVMQNIQAVLHASGCNLTNVTKTTIFLTNMNDYAKVNEIYGSYFEKYKPARSTVAVARLPKDALIEIEVIAVK